MPEERKALHAYLDAATHDTWALYAEDNGVSITGLLEALGTELAGEIDKAEANGGDATDVRPQWVKAARKIDATDAARLAEPSGRRVGDVVQALAVGRLLVIRRRRGSNR